MPPAMSAEERDRIVALAREGKGRNEIAHVVGRANSAVTKVVKAAGLSFDTTMTEIAVKTRSLRMAEMRQQLADEMLANALEFNQDARAQYEQVALGATQGGGSAWYTTTLERPPARDRKDLLSAASIAANTAMKLVEFDRGGSNSADMARTMVGGMVAALAHLRDTETSPSARPTDS